MKADKSSSDPNNREDLRKALQNESPKEIRALLDTWDALEKPSNGEHSFSIRETEEALAAVRHKAGLSEASPASAPAPVHNLHFSYRYAAAAAVLLIALLTGWLVTPAQLEAPRGSMIKGTLPDGTQVQLNSGSTLEYPRLFGWTNRHVTLNGEAYFEVEHDASLPFTIDAGPAGIRVLGTRFNVRSRNDRPDSQTIVTLLQGSLAFYPLSAPAMQAILHPGDQSALTASQQRPSAPRKVDTKYVTAWRSGDLAFEAQSLGQIFSELERRFDITIETGPDVDLQKPLSLYLSHPGNIEAILNDICQVRGLRFTSIKNGYRIYR